MAQAAVPAAADSAMQNFQIEEESVSDEDPHQEVAHLLHGHPDHAQSIQNEPLWNRGICCVYAINFFTTFATFHLYAPRSWLLEMAICRKFYESHDPSTITWQSGWPGFIIPEHACREKNIQKDLSHIRALSTFLEPLPALFLSVPYGALADAYGRKLVVCLGILGLVLSYTWYFIVCSYSNLFSTATVLASNVFLLIGAPPAFFIASVINLAVDLSTERTRSIRIYCLLAFHQAGSMLGAMSAALTMKIAWLPYLVALLAFLLSFFSVLTIPNTSVAASSVDRPSSSAHEESMSDQTRTPRHDTFTSFILHQTRSDFRLVAILIAFFLITVRLPMGADLVLLYVSKRYHWFINQASTLIGIGRGFDLFLAVFILPRISQILQSHCGFKASKVDLYVARYSAALLAIGAAIAGMAPNVGLFILGWIFYSAGFAIRMSLQAYATALVSQHQVVKLYSVLAVVETCGGLLGDPLLWKAWSLGLDVEGVGFGMPWFLVSLLLGLVSTILWALQGEEKSVEG